MDHHESLNSLLIDQYKFWPTPRKKGDIYYSGNFKVGTETVRVELRSFDKRLLEPPEAFIVDWEHEPALRKFLGVRHIESNGKICFYDPSRDVWDPTNAIRHFAGVIEKIEELLNSNLQSQSDDWLQDFQGYWRGEKVYLASKPTNGSQFNQWYYKEKMWLINADSPPKWMVADKKYIDQWYAVKIRKVPIPYSENWPPKNIREVIIWLSDIIDKPEMFLAKILLKEKFNKKTKGTHTLKKAFLFFSEESEVEQYFAFSFEITKTLQNAISQRRVNSLASLLKSNLLNMRVKAISPVRSDPEYIHSRSLPSGTKTLKNLYILQVGAGAIGGFLSQQLAALGAGWGKNAIFKIIDHDKLSTGNLGRHILGSESIGKFKSIELENHIRTSFPHLNIKGVKGSVLRDQSIFTRRPDIILNATGSEEVSMAIELILKNKYKSRPPTIHGWILGHGLAAQSFMRPSNNHPCYMCLWDRSGAKRKRRHELSKDPSADLPVFAPCHQSFYPFIVNVAVTSANLMIEHVISYMQSSKKETLIHYIFQKDKCFNRKNKTPPRVENCSICGDK